MVSLYGVLNLHKSHGGRGRGEKTLPLPKCHPVSDKDESWKESLPELVEEG